MQTWQVRIRLGFDDRDYLRKLSARSGLQQIDVASMLLHASIEALKQSKVPPSFPIQLCINTQTAQIRI
jgi:hypothetical protein